MHILVVIVFILLVVIFFMSRATRPSSNEHGAQGALPSPPDETAGDGQYTLAFISDGKLFYQTPGQELRELQSPHVQSVVERMERHQQLHGWKDGTSFGTSFAGYESHTPTDAVRIQATSAQFVTHDRVVYFLKDNSFGGLFEYDLSLDREKRLLHKQYLSLDDLRVHPDGHQLLCAQHTNNGAANIVAMDVNGDNLRELTSGDTVDAAPAWVPGQADSVLFQSSGLARNEAGYVVARGPDINSDGRHSHGLPDDGPRTSATGLPAAARRPGRRPVFHP